MTVFFLCLLLVINFLALLAYIKLYFLRSIGQIQAEVEQEMQQRAHQLLVRRDKLEAVGLQQEVLEANERWKDDLANYMEEFEQESIQRARRQFRRAS